VACDRRFQSPCGNADGLPRLTPCTPETFPLDDAVSCFCASVRNRVVRWSSPLRDHPLQCNRRAGFDPETQGRRLNVLLEKASLLHEQRTTVLCPSCKKRMSIRQVIQATSGDARKFIHHCAMCDIEIKQPAPLASNAPLESTTIIRDPSLAGCT
jgi:hypothetical protein